VLAHRIHESSHRTWHPATRHAGLTREAKMNGPTHPRGRHGFVTAGIPQMFPVPPSGSLCQGKRLDRAPSSSIQGMATYLKMIIRGCSKRRAERSP
jgi:hypothetical protein